MTGRARLVGRAVLMLGALVACVAPAHAQSSGAAQPSRAPRQREVVVGGFFAGPIAMGSANAELLGANGEPSVTLFRTSNKLASGVGAELALGFRLAPAVRLEISGGWARANLVTRVSDDFEAAEELTISGPATRFSAEGALLWFFRDRGQTAWFVRASAGAMRESSGALAVGQIGLIGSGGVGVRRWFGAATPRTSRRIGIRVEARGVIRSGGASLGSRSIHIGPAGAVQLVFGY